MLRAKQQNVAQVLADVTVKHVRRPALRHCHQANTALPTLPRNRPQSNDGCVPRGFVLQPEVI